MGSLQTDFNRFLFWLSGEEAEADQIRLANLMTANLDQIASVGVNQGKRSKLLIRIAQAGLDTTSDCLPTFDEEDSAVGSSWKRLKHLTVGPFRGFSRPESFDLDRRIILVYGPNGSGKSSFCEALEHSLLGAVGEAEAKRIDQPSYFVNARVGSFEAPVLLGVGEGGEEVVISPDEERLRFCFIEKNRIDAFSRIASKTATERSRLIATLFGVEGFDEFVRGFNDSLDAYLDLVGVKKAELVRARETLAADLEKVREAPERAEKMKGEEAELAKKFDPGMTFEGLTAHIGSPDAPGRLKQVEEELDKALPVTIGVTSLIIEDNLKQVTEASTSLRSLEQELSSRQGEVSFKQLYLAVEALRATSPERCPACDTPLEGPNGVVQDPYEKAKTGLTALGELAHLEDRHTEAKEEVVRTSKALQETLRKVSEFAANLDTPEPMVVRALQGIPVEATGEWWQSLLEPGSDGQSTWQTIRAVIAQIEQHDAGVQSIGAVREELKKERTRLQEFNDLVVAQQTKRTEWADALKKAQGRIAAFDVTNRPLLEEVEAEAPRIEKNLRIKAAYDALLPRLRRFRDGLPGTLVADLNETTMLLYNGFNRDDPGSDHLVELKLPLTNSDIIEVTFSGDPGRQHNALHVMSEGHIRCLGLAILVAKNIKSACPLLIFDDAVNAIDDDHRSGIRHTIFEGPQIQGKQIVLTCHGEEFIKDTKQLLGAEVVKTDCRFYVFLPHEGDNILQVDSDPTSRNYLVAAREKFTNRETRESLTDARKATESLSRRTWTWLEKRGHGTLKLTFDGPKSKPEARNLVDSVLKNLQKDTLVDGNKVALIEGFQCLQAYWSYLNTGTHEWEDIREFDREVVSRILTSLEVIDRVVNPAPAVG